jgi:hypothetical protein
MYRTDLVLQTISISDLDDDAAVSAAMRMHLNADRKAERIEAYRGVVHSVGGRLSYLKRVAHAADMDAAAARLVKHEKSWLLSQIGLIPDHDDDVMDEQKWSSCSWLLLREFVKMRQEQEKERDEQIAAGERSAKDTALPLPFIPYVSPHLSAWYQFR